MNIKEELKKIPFPGYRTIKTSVSVVLCLILYKVLDREGITLAIISAIMCMQDSVEKSINFGKNRIIGTIIGGCFGAILTISGLTGQSYFMFLLCALFGTIIIIQLVNILNIKQSVVISCNVFLIILTDAVKASDPIMYSISRTIDTLIGIVISVIVNTTLFRPTERIEDMKAPVVYDILRADNQKKAKWKGGTTSELYIYPEDSFYQDRNFDFRISTATVDVKSTDFTKLPGYKRYIMLLDGKMKLIHENEHSISLEKYGVDFFKGDWNTKSYGKCRDLNLMAGENISSNLEAVRNNYENTFTTKKHLSLFSLLDEVEIEIKTDDNKIYTEVLNKYDYICFEHDPIRKETDYAVKIKYKEDEENLLIMAKIECE